MTEYSDHRERSFQRARRKVHKKISVPIKYGDITFPTQRVACTKLGINRDQLMKAIKKGTHEGIKIERLK